MLIFSLLSACSTPSLYRLKDGDDLLSQESMWRNDLSVLEKAEEVEGPLALCHLEKFSDALRKFDALYEKNKDNFWYWNDLATCYLLKKEVSIAKIYYQTALALAQNSQQKAVVYNNLGVIYYSKKNYEQSKILFEQAKKGHGFYLAPQFNLARIYLQFFNLSEASKYASTLEEKNGHDPEVINLSAHLAFFKKDFALTLKTYDRLDDRLLNRRDFGIIKSLALYGSNDFDEALEVVKSTRPSNEKYYDQLTKDLTIFYQDKIKEQELKEKQQHKITPTPTPIPTSTPNATAIPTTLPTPNKTQ